MKDRFAADWDEGIANQRHKGRRVGTLWMEKDSGDVTLTMHFSTFDALYRADVLGDIIGVLHREYDYAVTGVKQANNDD
jgi:hypothetical protein